ncbi:MAG: hypothetical protein LBE08_00205 [Bifidobacteriaceae bacterium]|nr:hypothetical protein [Bifidobacteriaceae bacterium]
MSAGGKRQTGTLGVPGRRWLPGGVAASRSGFLSGVPDWADWLVTGYG